MKAFRNSNPVWERLRPCRVGFGKEIFGVCRDHAIERLKILHLLFSICFFARGLQIFPNLVGRLLHHFWLLFCLQNSPDCLQKEISKVQTSTNT
jgi:hypothetical protein